MTEITYRVFDCPNGHTWDVYGAVTNEKIFIPEDMATVKCPSCMRTAVDLDGREPERLA